MATIATWVGKAGSAESARVGALITADGGGIECLPHRLWKMELALLAEQNRPHHHGARPAAGTSKWNRIEYCCFISINLRDGLTSHEVIVNTIAVIITCTGSTVDAELDTASYPRA